LSSSPHAATLDPVQPSQPIIDETTPPISTNRHRAPKLPKVSIVLRLEPESVSTTLVTMRKRYGVHQPLTAFHLLKDLPVTEDLLLSYRRKLSDFAKKRSPFSVDVSGLRRKISGLTKGSSRVVAFHIKSTAIKTCHAQILLQIDESTSGTHEWPKQRWNPQSYLHITSPSLSNEAQKSALAELKRDSPNWSESLIITGTGLWRRGASGILVEDMSPNYYFPYSGQD
jgi:hypothetical protein